mgnify:CR=1 FL=1
MRGGLIPLQVGETLKVGLYRNTIIAEIIAERAKIDPAIGLVLLLINSSNTYGVPLLCSKL